MPPCAAGVMMPPNDVTMSCQQRPLPSPPVVQPRPWDHSLPSTPRSPFTPSTPQSPFTSSGVGSRVLAAGWSAPPRSVRPSGRRRRGAARGHCCCCRVAGSCLSASAGNRCLFCSQCSGCTGSHVGWSVVHGGPSPEPCRVVRSGTECRGVAPAAPLWSPPSLGLTTVFVRVVYSPLSRSVTPEWSLVRAAGGDGGVSVVTRQTGRLMSGWPVMSGRPLSRPALLQDMADRRALFTFVWSGAGPGCG